MLIITPGPVKPGPGGFPRGPPVKSEPSHTGTLPQGATAQALQARGRIGIAPQNATALFVKCELAQGVRQHLIELVRVDTREVVFATGGLTEDMPVRVSE